MNMTCSTIYHVWFISNEIPKIELFATFLCLVEVFNFQKVIEERLDWGMKLEYFYLYVMHMVMYTVRNKHVTDTDAMLFFRWYNDTKK